jgi:hypothetical protein
MISYDLSRSTKPRGFFICWPSQAIRQRVATALTRNWLRFLKVVEFGCKPPWS